jgi:hypothetical protein
MRTILATFAGLVALAAVSAQAAPVPPSQSDRGRARRLPGDRAGAPRMRVGLAPRQVAGPLGLLALGWLLPELVTSPRVVICT